VVQQVDVAAAQGERTMVLATGSRSEQAALRMYPELDEVCFVEVGDYTGVALRRAAAAGMASAVLVAMAGKITKLAAGVMMTHFHRSRVDNELMVRAATATSAPPAVVESAGATATARHFFETCVREGFVAPLRLMCEWARGSCEEHTGGKLAVSVKMTDFEGSRVVASA
jgi:cobalt-precorrin-5B (C1)-methyltransferase